MAAVSFECEVVTPMFMDGAQRKHAEIRASSVRGIARWWFRAMMGGVLGDNLRDLYRSESIIFGDTKSGSPISVRIRDIDPDPPKSSSLPRLPHKTEEHKKAWWNAIEPHQRFNIALSLINNHSPEDEVILSAAEQSFCETHRAKPWSYNQT